MPYFALLKDLKAQGAIDAKSYAVLEEMFSSFSQSTNLVGQQEEAYKYLLLEYLQCIIQESRNPYRFDLFHQAIHEPYDYYRLGREIFRPMVIFEKSKIFHPERVQEIEDHLVKNENVILFANHQIEPDPQVLSLMLEKESPHLAEEMIFIAGHRVVSDPVAIPFSKGCNLLCIFSKKHIEHPPEKKKEKLLHNQRTMQRMSELLAEGGKCIYVAPSGGRDRKNPETGKVELDPFDAASIEMFLLMSQQSGKKTHFYPLSLSTYNLLPPPQSVDKELGERRVAKRSPVYLSFGPEIDMANFPGGENLDKKAKRVARAQYIWELVKKEYDEFPK